MSGFRHRAQEVLREAFIVEESRSQTRGRIVAGAMIYVPAVVGLILVVVYAFLG